MAANEVIIKIKGDATSAQRAIEGTQSRLKKLGDQARKIGFAFTAMGAGISAVGFLAVRTFASFEQTMARVQAVSGATAEEFEQLTALAKEMGTTTVFTANQSAQALAFMAQAGLDVNEQLSGLPAVLELAAAGQLELAAAADIVTNVMAGFGLSADNLTRANDVLVTGFTQANTDLLQLGQAFKLAGPVAKAAGLSFEETAAALALMGNAGIQASMAGTGLRGAISRLLNPGKESADIIRQLGLEVTDSGGKMMSMTSIIRQLEDTGLTAGDAMQLFGQRAGPAMLALVSQGSEALAELTSSMEDSGGTAKRIAERQLDTFQGQITLLRSAVEGLALSIGQVLVPAIAVIADIIRPIVAAMANWVEKHKSLAQVLTIAIASLGALLLVIGPLLIVLPSLAAGIGLVTGAFTALTTAMIRTPIGLILTGISGIVGLLAANWVTSMFQMRDATKEVSQSLQELALTLTRDQVELAKATLVSLEWELALRSAQLAQLKLGEQTIQTERNIFLLSRRVLELSQEISESWLLVTEAEIALNKMTVTIGETSEGFKSLKTVIGTTTDPLNRLTASFATAAIGASGFADKVSRINMGALLTSIKRAGNIFSDLSGEAADAANFLSQRLMGAFATAATGASDFANSFQQSMKTVRAEIIKVATTSEETLAARTANAIDTLAQSYTLAGEIAKKTGLTIGSVMEAAAESVRLGGGSIVSALQQIIRSLEEVGATAGRSFGIVDRAMRIATGALGGPSIFDEYRFASQEEMVKAVLNQKNMVPQAAHGVRNFIGGPVIVGEQGPELVNLPSGSDVIPNAGGGAGGAINVNVFLDGQQINTSMGTSIEDDEQVRGS